MFKNYILTAIRNIVRNKAFSFINISGLSLGLACSLLVFLWIDDEKKTDGFNEHSDRIYSVYARQYAGDNITAKYNTPGLLANEMKRVMPEVALASGFTVNELHTFRVGDRVFKKEGGYADKDFFSIFSYELLAGDRSDALAGPNNICISKAMAEDLFGSASSAIGKTVNFENNVNFKITGVFDVPSRNSSIKFDYLINWDALMRQYPVLKNWGNTAVRTFFLLKENVNADSFEHKMTNFLASYNKYDKNYKVELGIQRFDEMYLHSSFNKEGKIEGGRIEYVWLFSIVAVFILVIACINFMNLTTARSIRRAREIGVRKTVGATRLTLIYQFMGEALFLSVASTLIAIILVACLLYSFNNLTQKSIGFPFLNGDFWLSVVGITLITGLISGSYPALFLSSFEPVKVLRGAFKMNAGNRMFRKGLVIFQFFLSVIITIGTIVVSRQVNYIQTKNLGFERNNLIYIPVEGELASKYNTFREEALKMPGIKYVSRINVIPTDVKSSTSDVDWQGKDPNTKISFGDAGVGYDFVKTMNMQMAAGREFSKEFATDSGAFILNEEAVAKTGYKDPIGKPFKLWNQQGIIIGVVKDFHFNSLYVPVNPFVMYFGERENGGKILIKTQPGKIKEALASLEMLSRELNPKFPFTYQFSDEEYNNLYRSENIIGRLANWFALLGILISSLGLLGLTIFTVERRTKEIGIRKALGATATSLFGLLSKEFLSLVLVALLIAFPVAWFFMYRWLQGFAYHISINWIVFAMAGFGSIFIALATISFQVIKAVRINTVKGLKTE